MAFNCLYRCTNSANEPEMPGVAIEVPEYVEYVLLLVVEKTLVPKAQISGFTRPSCTGPQLLLLDSASVVVILATKILFLADLPLLVIVDQPPVQPLCEFPAE